VLSKDPHRDTGKREPRLPTLIPTSGKQHQQCLQHRTKGGRRNKKQRGGRERRGTSARGLESRGPRTKQDHDGHQPVDDGPHADGGGAARERRTAAGDDGGGGGGPARSSAVDTYGGTRARQRRGRRPRPGCQSGARSVVGGGSSRMLAVGPVVVSPTTSAGAATGTRACVPDERGGAVARVAPPCQTDHPDARASTCKWHTRRRSAGVVAQSHPGRGARGSFSPP